MNKFLLSLLTTSCGLCAGILLSGQINNVGKTFAMAGTMSAPLVFVAHVISDSKAEKRVREIQKKADKSASELSKIQSELSRIESYNRSIQTSLESLKQQLATCESAKVKVESRFDALAPIARQLESELNSAKARISELLEQVEDLQAVCEQWEVQFDSQLALQVDARVKELRRAELLKIFNDHDALVQQASEIIHRFQNWSEVVGSKHEAKRQLIVDLSERYSENINEANESFDKEKETYLREIEGLHEKVARLQQELSGGLLEPELVDAKYNPDLDLGNSLCRQIFYQVKIPLRFYHAYTSEDGITHLGFMTSRGADREAIAYRINSESKALAATLGLYKIESVAPSDVVEGIEIRARRSRPQALSEDAIYRIMERPQACTGILRDAMNHRKGGKPSLRIMSGTGGGKSLVAKVFIADWVKTQSGEVWLSDPMDGSEEDYWQIPKAARSAREGSALLGEFVGEFNARKNKSSSHKDILVLGVFDEFDKQHPDSDKEKVQKVWTAIRHHQMNLILMGQSSEVGVNGWTWDEMKNCSLLFVGDAITTAIKQAKNIGLSQATKRQIERNYDTIKLYLEDKNKGLDSDVMYRVALLVVGEKFKFLELPSALKGSIENDSAAIVETPWGSVVIPTVASEITTTKKRPNCPVCGSEKVRKCGDRWKCENSEHPKELGVKSWKITNS